MTNQMNSGRNGVLLVVGAYIITMGVIIFSIMLIMFLVVDTHKCSTLSRALATLWTIIGLVLLISTVLTGIVARKIIPNRVGCLASLAAHVIATLVCSSLLAFVMMLAFNC